MQDVYDYIEAHRPEALADLHVFCAQPSVSTESRGMDEMAVLVQERLQESGFHVELIPVEGGFPVLYAESSDPVPDDTPTLLIYNHYDVQPEGDLTLWATPPFEPSIRDGKMIARGVADNKGNIVARLAAIDALRAVRGGLPIRIKWIIEGEEEIGSPHLDAFLLEQRERLGADGCIWEFGTYTWDGTPQVMLGLKGMVEVALTARGANRDLHSSMAAYISSPVWRLVLALAAIKDENEGIQIPGFYDQMLAPSETQIAMVAALPDDDATALGNLGLEEFALGLRGFRRHMAEVFAPTCNIQGIVAGYPGPGTKTVLPNEARATLDLRLVPDQDPVEVAAALRAYLDEAGFTDIEIAVEPGSLYPARTDPDHPFVQQVIAAVGEAAGGTTPVVWPSSPASGPMYAFTNGLGLPVVAIGVGNPASSAHGPNENVRLSDFWAGTQQIAAVIARLGTLTAADLQAVPATAGTDDDMVPFAQVFETDSLFTLPPADFDFDVFSPPTDADEPDLATPTPDSMGVVFDPEMLFTLSDSDRAFLEASASAQAPPAAAPPVAAPPAAAPPVAKPPAAKPPPRKRRTRKHK